MASLGLLISRSLYLSQSLITLVVWFGVGAPMLLAVNKIVGVLIFPALSIEDEIYTAVRQHDPAALRRLAQTLKMRLCFVCKPHSGIC